ncbi:MAG: F0F1 ATP synthase subunit delta, partial [Hyphomicrobiales bacterium]
MATSSSPVSGVAERYALSLFELARDEGSVDTVESELAAFGGLIEDSADFRRLVLSPSFTSEEQLAAISGVVAQTRPSQLTGNFLKVIAANRRLFALPAMIRSFKAMAAAHRGGHGLEGADHRGKGEQAPVGRDHLQEVAGERARPRLRHDAR